MRLLLDTHAFLWYVTDDARLSAAARAAASSGDVRLSVASLWEMAIKHGLGKLDLPGPFATFFEAQLAVNGFGLVPVELAHLDAYAALPFHHRDPFDRMIVAQALAEGFTVVSRDPALARYGVEVLW